MLQSKLFDLSVMDAHEYAELFDAEVQRLLDIHALMPTRRRRCGQHDNRNLSDEARQAKQLRRRRERRYRRTGLQSDKAPTSSLFCCTWQHSQVTCWSVIRSKLDKVSGDIGATWWTAQRLLHNDHRVVYDDAECAKLVSMFSQFFVVKVNRIRRNITEAL